MIKKTYDKYKKISIKSGDVVRVISGEHKGNQGVVLRVDFKKERVFVENINMRKKAMKRKSENDTGGIIEVEGSIHISNVKRIGGAE